MYNSVMISKEEKEMGKEISDNRKEIIYRVYKKFGNINEHKLNELLHLKGSPLCANDNPSLLAYTMSHNISLKDEQLVNWYVDFLEYLDNNE